MDHDGQHLLATDEAAVEKGQPRGHQNHEAGAEHHEEVFPVSMIIQVSPSLKKLCVSSVLGN